MNPWDELEKDPEFRAKMKRALADFKAGRTYRMKRTPDGRHEFLPNPRWPKHGEQPR